EIHGCDQRAPLIEFHHASFQRPLRLEQRGATSESFVQGTSSVLWPAATKLATYLCDGDDGRPGAPGGRPWAALSVLEVGAGLGLVGALVARKHGAACAALGAKVVLTDCGVAELLAADSVNVEVCQLDWGSKSDESAILKEHGQFELIDLDKLFSSCYALLARSPEARLVLAFEFREDWEGISNFIGWAEEAQMEVQHQELGDPDDEIYLYIFRWIL
ncbi:Protein N-lysine methyltransferase METTL21A (Fragment), partial [Durusdinium trenchii]